MSQSFPYKCSICDFQAGTKYKWKNHLLHRDHLRETRAKWGDKTSKECCLLAYPSKIKGKPWLVNWFSVFSSDDRGDSTLAPAKNILWWDERPRITIIEFETREQTDAALAASSVISDDTYLRRATELHDLEWLALFPEKIAKRLHGGGGENGREETENGSATPGKRKLESSGRQDGEDGGPSKVRKVIESPEKPDCPLKELNKLAQSRGWLPPEYFFSKMGNPERKQHMSFLCVVLVDGVEWARETIHCDDENEARRQIALKALKAIQTSAAKNDKQPEVPEAPPPRLPQKGENSSSNGAGAVVPENNKKDGTSHQNIKMEVEQDGLEPIKSEDEDNLTNSSVSSESNLSENLEPPPPQKIENGPSNNAANKKTDKPKDKPVSIKVEPRENDGLEPIKSEDEDDLSNENNLSENLELEPPPPQKTENVSSDNAAKSKTDKPKDKPATIKVEPDVNDGLEAIKSDDENENDLSNVSEDNEEDNDEDGLSEDEEEEQMEDSNAAQKSDKPSEYIKLLEELTVKRGWRKPDYFSSKVLLGIIKLKPKRRRSRSKGKLGFSCRVLVNGVEYRPPPKAPGHTSRVSAMNYIAAVCLQKLESSDDTSVPPPVIKQEPFSGVLEPILNLPAVFINESLDSTTPQFSDYWSIRKSVMIPDDQYNTALEVISTLEKFLRQHDPQFEVTIMGNWALKLKRPFSACPDEDEPVVYLHHPQSSWNPQQIFGRIFRGASQIESPFAVIDFKPQAGKFRVLYKPNGFTFSLVSLKSYLLEAQTTRLLQYLCTFDARFHHTISMAQYWTSENSVILEEAGKPFNFIMLPWLVSVYLCRKRYLPTPREIQERLHKVIKDPISEIDIGFHPDANFVQCWTPPPNITRFIPGKVPAKDIPLEAVKVFPEFLKLLLRGKLLQGKNWLINTRDAEWINKREFCKSRPVNQGSTTWSSNMSIEEISALRELIMKKNMPKNEWFEKVPWYLTNPFVVTCRFPILLDMQKIENVLRLVNYSGGRFDSIVGRVKKMCDGIVAKEVIELESSLKIGSSLREQLIKDPKSVKKDKRENKRKDKEAMRLAKKGMMNVGNVND